MEWPLSGKRFAGVSVETFLAPVLVPRRLRDQTLCVCRIGWLDERSWPLGLHADFRPERLLHPIRLKEHR